MTAEHQVTRSREGGESKAAVYHTPMRLWVCVVFMVAGFVVVGVGFVLMSWIVMTIGGVVFIVAGIASMALGIMDNVH